MPNLTCTPKLIKVCGGQNPNALPFAWEEVSRLDDASKVLNISLIAILKFTIK